MKISLNRDEIKYFAMLTMLLNHISAVFLVDGTFLAELFSDIGYFTAITMCYFMVEGYQYTRSKKKYALRLFAFALISQIPFMLAFTKDGILEFESLNVMFTLLICFGILMVDEKVERRKLKVILEIFLMYLTLFCDWALFAPIFTMLFIWSKGSKEKTKVAFAVSALIYGITYFAAYADKFSIGTNIIRSLGAMAGIVLSGIVIVYFYNGKRMEKGREFSKWFFYLFYPVHLLILGLIRICI